MPLHITCGHVNFCLKCPDKNQARQPSLLKFRPGFELAALLGSRSGLPSQEKEEVNGGRCDSLI